MAVGVECYHNRAVAEALLATFAFSPFASNKVAWLWRRYIGPSVGNYWKVLSRYTLADSANTAYALVRRDGNGDFSARDANLRDVLATGVVKIDGTQVVGNQGAAVANASGETTVDAEARAAINDLLPRLRAHGLIAT